jgi:hypothetical protein
MHCWRYRCGHRPREFVMHCIGPKNTTSWNLRETGPAWPIRPFTWPPTWPARGVVIRAGC